MKDNKLSSDIGSVCDPNMLKLLLNAGSRIDVGSLMNAGVFEQCKVPVLATSYLQLS